ncbi:hypothetical protein [Bradyrhizobium sp. USDA 4520]
MKRPYSRARQRRNHTEKLIIDRHGGLIRQAAVADAYVLTAAECCGQILKDEGKELSSAAIAERLSIWCGTWIIQSYSDEQIGLISAQAAKLDGWIPPDDHVGERLKLTYDDRERLGISTIGPCDVHPEEREERRLEKRRLSAEAGRRAKGCKPRKDWLAEHSASRTKPWIAEGISRATYYRRKKGAAD